MTEDSAAPQTDSTTAFDSTGGPRERSGFDELLADNERYAARFHLQGLAGFATSGFALVTCMDSRIEPLSMLGLVPGDAKIMRNAGGRVTEDTLRSLTLAAHSLGVRRIAVMQHTDCAMMKSTDTEVGARIGTALGRDPVDFTFRTIADPDADLAADVALVRDFDLLPAGVEVAGWRYDVETGRVLVVVDPTTTG
ncbi:carbonic anhydrase [Rhodococcus aerolatus]